VATFQAFQHGVGAFMATRLLLGLCESGFIPAGLYTITRWYKREETSKRFSWFFIGNMLAQASGGLLAYGVLHMRGVANLAGWQWLFILEGIFTILVGFVFFSLMPSGPANPVSRGKIRWFTESESRILIQRVLLDDPTKRHGHKNITRQEFKKLVSGLDTALRLYTYLSLVHELASYPSYYSHHQWAGTFLNDVGICTYYRTWLWVRTPALQRNGLNWTVVPANLERDMGHACRQMGKKGSAGVCRSAAVVDLCTLLQTSDSFR
jgi:MFS family permease